MTNTLALYICLAPLVGGLLGCVAGEVAGRRYVSFPNVPRGIPGPNPPTAYTASDLAWFARPIGGV